MLICMSDLDVFHCLALFFLVVRNSVSLVVLISQILYATQCEFSCLLLHCLITPRMLSS